MGKIKAGAKNCNMEELWSKFKQTLIITAKIICGMISNTKDKRKTHWWNEEIKEETKLKKRKWEKYIRNKTNENYAEYKEQRTRTKELVKKAKQKSWEEFGDKMEKDRVGNQKLFYRILKTLRKGKEIKCQHVTSKEGETLTEPGEIMTRWKEYYDELLNTETTDMQDKEEESRDNEKDGNEQEEDFKMDEVIEEIKKN